MELFDNVKELIEYLKDNEISYEQIGDYGNITVIYHIGEYRVRYFFCPHWKDKTRTLDYIKIDKELI